MGIIRIVISVGYLGHCHSSRLVKFLVAVLLVLALVVEVVVLVATIGTFRPDYEYEYDF